MSYDLLFFRLSFSCFLGSSCSKHCKNLEVRIVLNSVQKFPSVTLSELNHNRTEVISCMVVRCLLTTIRLWRTGSEPESSSSIFALPTVRCPVTIFGHLGVVMDDLTSSLPLSTSHSLSL